ncbi:hypothetical protein HAX54_001879 [Datura stramonium]|uniref:DDE Tnp4 domain-containing protein n=1 Tax=Datura stramonium TaxID=4076 RepID=A0ABS8T320_DATST|nr:hypothetical protein [Datura stramonium]
MVKPTNITGLSGKFLSLDDRVAVSLRRRSSGDSLSTIGESLRDANFLIIKPITIGAILQCCLLHNILIDLNDGVQDEVPVTHRRGPDYGK